jgi:hypothetical protein
MAKTTFSSEHEHSESTVMSHTVHYMTPIDAVDFSVASTGLLDAKHRPVTLAKNNIPLEFELRIHEDLVHIAVTRNLGFLIIWTNINYYRFLHHGEMEVVVERLDEWVRRLARRAVRLDELFVDEWTAQNEELESTTTYEVLIDWLKSRNPQGTHWKEISS